MLTTYYSYGTVEPRRQGEIIKTLAKPAARATTSAEEEAAAGVKAMRQNGVSLN